MQKNRRYVWTFSNYRFSDRQGINKEEEADAKNSRDFFIVVNMSSSAQTTLQIYWLETGEQVKLYP
jgi:hypothetical protein